MTEDRMQVLVLGYGEMGHAMEFLLVDTIVQDPADVRSRIDHYLERVYFRS